jgi:predicted RNase H-like HicB family nuclease
VTTIDDYMKAPYRMEVVEDVEEGGFVVSFPELRGCITCGETIEKAIAAAKDAKRAWLEAAMEDGFRIPAPGADNAYSGQFKFRLPRSLHRMLSENAKREGVSMNQYCIYLLTKLDTANSDEHMRKIKPSC